MVVVSDPNNEINNVLACSSPNVSIDKNVKWDTVNAELGDPVVYQNFTRK